MRLVQISLDAVLIGQPLPFPLMGKDGVLLAKKAYIIKSKKDLTDIADRSGGLFINETDSDTYQRALLDKFYGLVRDDKALNDIVGANMNNLSEVERRTQEDNRADWMDLQEQANTLLRDHNSVLFMGRLDRLQHQLNRRSTLNPDGTLFALIYLSGNDRRMYSATHAMLVSVMCGIAVREVLRWPPAIETMLCKAALTMNVGMTELQDRLARQSEPLTAEQRSVVNSHTEKSVELLMSMGVTDAIWLEAVRGHHNQAPGPLNTKTPAQRLARVIQRADSFAARLAPRASRNPIAPAAAMKACYFDENSQIDDVGGALIKAVGIYPPGTYVRLATEEIAVVVQRGLNTTMPKVAVMINRSGMPTVDPIVRDTSLSDYRIVASVPHREVKIQINLEKLLNLTTGSNRPW
jgi:HD-GYP domain-containing protein (c-di-GMP phosphodiesterase class II)